MCIRDSIIIEGIFGQEIFKTLSKENYLLIKLKANKQTCLNRVIKRDFLERGKRKDIAKRDFIKAWELFHENKKKYHSKNNLNTIVIRKKSDIDLLLKEIINLVN